MTYLLLSWSAADLLVPQLCDAEVAIDDHAGDPSALDCHDCFCCCAHTEKAIVVAVTYSEGPPVIVDDVVVAGLPTGAPRAVYHPPLAS